MVLKNNGRAPFVSIVVPTYNRALLLCECIKSVMQLEYPQAAFEIIIVDDGSTDGSEAYLKRTLAEMWGKIKYLQETTNRGVAAARNRGFAAAKGEIIACLDDDCRVQKDWLQKIIATFTRYPHASAVGGSIVNVTESPLAWASYIIEFSTWLPWGRMRPVTNIPTCNIAYRRETIAGCTFLEEYKGSGFEDSLFNYNLICSGKTIIFNPAIQCPHYKWEGNFTEEDYCQSQKRYALGFVKGGYRVFGVWGEILIKVRVLNLLCLRLVLVFSRCLRSKKCLVEFVRNFTLILRGEWMRNKLIYEYLLISREGKITA
ncbi:MAG: glycosyltransferase family 2 protein [Candidatus Omnitrophica bacterium]|nr:glycosyltransferase family 2 protein [Candidatus Omnitrophota bacterium]